ncbi:DUF1724 domain-containing protein [archaeon]|nr:MAG: DUF1724 domain-containing protein [archaeon]
MKTSDLFDQAEMQLKALTRSKVRAKTMLCLEDGEKNIGALEKEIGTRATTILHAIRNLIDADLVTRAENGYTLTNIGRVQTHLINELVSAITILDQHKDYWLTHDISGIPEELLSRIGMLGRSEVVRADPAALLKAQTYFMEKIIESKVIRGVSPIIIPGYAETITACVENGIDVELVLTDSIIDLAYSDYYKGADGLLEFENFRLYKIKADVKVAFTVSDEHLYMGLFRQEGGYDLGNDLFCTGKAATRWGMELYEFYRNMSELVETF